MKAKTKLTKLWSILLAVVLVISMIPTVALATESATADFSDDPTTALALFNAAKTGEADSTWDSTTNTLTLNGVDFETTADTAVKLPDNSTIVLNGVNTIAGVGSSSEDSYGIYAEGSLIISGTGTLNVTCGNAKEYSHGIYAEDYMTITGGNVTVTGGTSNYDNSYGIYVDYDIKISGGTVKAIGGAAYNYSLGIYADNVYISGTADVTAEGGSAANDDSNGICAYYNVTITGGTVKATAGTANSWSVGISADNGAVSISGGTVETTGGSAGYNSYGIYADETVTIGGGTLIAKANTKAMNKAPSALPTAYWWRTSNSSAYHKYPDSAYIWDAAHTYFEIQKPGYTVTFDANGGSGEMTGADVVSGEYTLPANGFTAPEGKQFKCWSVDGKEKAVGDKITVAADTIVKAVWENIPATPTPTEYEILDGANGSWTQNSDGSLSFRGSGAFSEFVGVKVDGNLVDAKNYTVKEGSTIVTLNADYLNTLAAGNHTLEIVWTDGSASTSFTVSAKAVVDNNTKSPQTGDNSMMALWIAVLFVSGFGVVATAVYGKKRKSVK